MHLLETGVHEKESKEKFRVEKKTRNGAWELVYAHSNGELVLIHVKFLK